MTSIFEESRSASVHCAKTLINLITIKPSALICLAAGHTSLEMFEELIRAYHDGQADFSQVRVVDMDEWVGLSAEDDGSCEGFLRKNLYDHINVQEKHIRMFNGKADDLEQECRAMDAHIEANGGIDYMLLGLGMNGHLALNEPGVDPSQGAHVVPLDSVTRRVAVKYFREMPDISQGITLGVWNILQTRHIQLLITGERKRDIVKEMMDSAPTVELPGTLLKGHANVEIVVDKQAAGLIEGISADVHVGGAVK
jgi:glucosamine-6-phosphate isomerase